MVETRPVLTAKEKQTLRLLLEGYDAKSAARHLGLSVHTVNERLRDARRKLGVSSSREAARVLRESEQTAPESFADMSLGGEAGANTAQIPTPDRAHPQLSRVGLIGGGTAMIFALALAVMSANSTPSSPPVATTVAAETPAIHDASEWLALVDAGKWPESFAATSAHFRANHTLEIWTKASVDGRVPMGAVLSREATTEMEVPAPEGAGGMVVRFRTDFANKAHAVETLSLTREEGKWKMVGYWIE